MTPRPITAASVAATAAAALLLLAAAACSAPAAPKANQPSGSSTHVPSRRSASGTPQAPSGSTSGSSARRVKSPAGCAGKGIRVSTAAQLQAALAAARPGTRIKLAARVFTGDFAATASGTRARPITLCGSRNAILEGESTASGYTFYLNRASWWRLEGFSVKGGQKGVVADGVTHDLIYGLFVHGTGDEAIHLRSFSSHNLVMGNIVRDTGLHEQKFGEGIYVGSANSNWCRYTKCHPDASNYNVLADNNIANTSAESIDIKEGTTGGRIVRNHFNGTGMVPDAATAWINVKGNDWVILHNTGVNSSEDGYQVHQVYPGWGIGNVFRGNKATLNGAGYAVYVQSHDLRTVVACNNTLTGAAGHLSNISCSAHS
jgi:hypothetical protein